MKIVGGRIFEKRLVSDQVSVTWKWINESEGTVEWIFQNDGLTDVSFLLYRNGYYFGNAFWPVYINNSQFNESFVSTPVPLTDRGTLNNSAPLCVATFGNGKSIVCFLFTLSTGQKWSMVEGGFSQNMPPADYSASVVKLKGAFQFCITYDETQVEDWDQQTGTTYTGYTPNPSIFVAQLVEAETNYVELFADKIKKDSC